MIKGSKHSEESILKMSIVKTGKHISDETKQKMRLSHLGEKGYWFGKHFSDETKLKLSESHAGQYISEETKQKLSEALIGKNFKGGVSKTWAGYIMIYRPDHPSSDNRGYVREHRLIMEESIGRYLTIGEVVHHINGVVDDNRLENLMLFANNAEHHKYHKQQRDLKCQTSILSI